MDKVTYQMYESALKEARRHLYMVFDPIEEDYDEDEDVIQGLISDILSAVDDVLDELKGLKEDA
ncbi:hypothetical protein [Listeria fleischmannii]|uniref:Uncharacterized protein n=1 Tax=Listeria fleischmannii FSL S10-1203 TaxID=1265822 RepID=W7D6Q4_9LIST|nr:hypothetical protein [Listeria fleischmannii]EUJ43491.1 hypothetical protein MCOL2_20513 [Listeria fleischmannii FSL S10-1203]